MRKHSKILAGSIVLMVSVVISRAAGMLLKIPLTNILGGTGMGYYSGAYAVFMPIYSLCAGSLTIAVARAVSEKAAFGDNRAVSDIRNTALRFFGAVGLILSLIPPIFAKSISERIIGIPEARLSIIAISPCIFFGTITAVLRGYYEGLGSMTPSSVSQTADSLVKLAVGLSLSIAVKNYALTLYASGKAVFGVYCPSEADAVYAALPVISAAAVLGTAAADLAGMLCLIASGRCKKRTVKTASRPPKDKRYRKKIVTELWKLCAPISLASVVSSLLNTIDLSTIVMLIGKTLRQNPELYIDEYSQVLSSGVALKELPNFLYGSFTGLGTSIFTLAPSLCMVFGRSAFPAVSQKSAAGDHAGVSKEIKRAMASALYIAIPAGFGLCLLSKEVLSLIFPSRTAEVAVSWQPLAILALGTAFITVSGISCSLLQALGRMDIPLKINVAGAILKLVLNMVMIPAFKMGLCGAAAATTLCNLMMCTALTISLYRLTNTKADIILGAAIPSVLGAGTAILALTLDNYLKTRLSSPISLVFSVIFAVITYIISTCLLDISTKNRIRTQFFG